MVFAEVIGAVALFLVPNDTEVALFAAVADPEVTHVHGFGAFLFDGVVTDALGGVVVSDEVSWWLGMAEFL